MNRTSFTMIPTTDNSDWGFWGTWEVARGEVLSREARGTDTERDIAIVSTSDAWRMVFERKAYLKRDALRRFLDDRSGRHLADWILSRVSKGATLEQAIDETTMTGVPLKQGATIPHDAPPSRWHWG